MRKPGIPYLILVRWQGHGRQVSGYKCDKNWFKANGRPLVSIKADAIIIKGFN